MHKTTILALGVLLLILGAPIHAQTTLVVNSDRDVSDQIPGDGDCDTGATIGLAPECTLRAALHEANQTTGPVVIEFWDQIETSLGWTIIEVGSGGLPAIENEITIAGDTHPDYDPDEAAPRVIIESETTTNTIDGLSILGNLASNSVIRAISIVNFTGNGIAIEGGSDHTIDNVTIGAYWQSGNIFVLGNGQNGIRISDGSQGTLIRDSFILANDGHGVIIASCFVSVCHENITMTGNKIGLTPPFNGNLRPAGNGQTGILIGFNNGPNQIGGLAPSNIIASNQSNGIEIYSDAQTIQRNYIGIPQSPDMPSGVDPEDYSNGDYGILISSSDNLIGGRVSLPTGGSIGLPNEIGNVNIASISIDDQDISGADTDNNIVDYNLIGTDDDGNDYGDTNTTGVAILTGMANVIRNAIIHYHYNGITFSSPTGPLDPKNEAYANDIRHSFYSGVAFYAIGRLGGPDSSEANVIGENGSGVRVLDTTNTCCVEIIGNYIGTDDNGVDLGNTTGIQVSGDNLVDIGMSGGGNIIGHNTRAILLLGSASDTQIRANMIGLHPSAGPIGNETGIQFSLTTGNGASNTHVGYGPFHIMDPEDWSPGEMTGNVIAHSTIAGIDLSGANDATLNNSFRGNRFFSNNANAIDLGMESIDEGNGTATGPNNQINFPELDSSVTQYDEVSDEIVIRYRVAMETTHASYPIKVDFYLTDDTSNEGYTYIGTDSYASSDATSWKLTTLDVPSGIQVWNNLTATATDADGNTSQLSLEPVLLRELTDEIFRDRFEQ